MTRDYEDFSSIEDLGDDELRQLVRQRLSEHSGLDIDDMVVEIDNGMVRLQGRVGTESELRIAEHVLTDVVGIPEVDNQLVVDAIRRDETPMDIEDHLQAELAVSGLMLGEMPEQESPEVHLARGDEDLEERMFGTVNPQDAIAHGTSYNPPMSPTPEGMLGTDAGPGELGEDH
jgi:hypothetical protein